MYKHAWGKRPTPPAFHVRTTRIDRAQARLRDFLKLLILAEREGKPPPKMPWLLWKQYRGTVQAAGGLSAWAKERPEYASVQSAVTRSLKRTARGKRLNERTNGVGKKTNWTSKSRKRR